MRKYYALCSVFICHISFAQIQKTSLDISWERRDPLHSKTFIENQGQVTDQHGNSRSDVLYVFSDNNFNLVLKEHGFSYELFHYSKVDRASEATGSSEFEDPNNDEVVEKPLNVTVQRFDANFIGISSAVKVEAEEKTDFYSNYYLGNRASLTEVRSWKKIYYRNVYPNIDLVFIAPDKNQPLRYEYIVHPGGNPENIRIHYAGSGIQLKDESVFLQSGLGFIKEENLFSYQETRNNPVASSFALDGNTVYFKFGKYDSRSTLIIDPDIVWGSYYGNDFADDKPLAIQVDKNGNEIISGQTASQSNFVTSGTYQTTFGGGDYDAFVMKWSPSGQRIWATYYGGNNFDAGYGVFADANLNVYCTGHTFSNNNPVFKAFQPTFGGVIDAFVLKLSKDGFVKWATYYGGLKEESSDGGIFGDTNGDIYFAGITESNENISTPGSYQPLKAPKLDGFLVKFDSNGTRIWGTYYGGEERDRGHAVSIDKDHNVIYTGTAPSLTGIATPDAHQTVMGGLEDMWVAKFTPTGQRIWATYYGGEDFDHGRECDTDEDGNIYICGFTTSQVNIASTGAHQTSWSEGYYGNGNRAPDAFLAKFDPNGVRIFGTYLGGDDEDLGRVVHVQADGAVIFSGSSRSAGFGTSGVYQQQYAGGRDVYISKFLPNGTMDWFTYYGGPGDDDGQGMDVDANGYIYVAGDVNSLSGISTPGAFKEAVAVDTVDDCMVAKFIDRCYDRYEPNDILDSATFVTIAGKSVFMNGEINYSGDRDFFSFSNSSTNPNIKILLNNLPKNYDLYLYGTAGQKIAQSTNTGKTKEQIIWNTSLVGTYTVRVQGKGSGAFSDTICYNLKISLNKDPFRLLEELSPVELDDNISIFPNPASQNIQIVFNDEIIATGELKIFDAQGELRYSKDLTDLQSQSVDVSSWSEGLYFVQLVANGNTYREKFIISR